MSPKRVQLFGELALLSVVLVTPVISFALSELEPKLHGPVDASPGVLIAFAVSIVACWLTAQLHTLFQALAAWSASARVRFLVFGGMPRIVQWSIGRACIVIGGSQWNGGGTVYFYQRGPRDWQMFFVPIMTLVMHLGVGFLLFF